MKQCKKCNEIKNESEFKGHPETKDKLTGDCRACINKAQREKRALTNNSCTYKYEKTKKGFLVRCYRNMLSRVTGIQKLKKHLYMGKDIIDKEMFYSWSINDNDFNTLFDNWQKSEYIRVKTPSIDRKDSSKGYTMENIRWITFSENCSIGGKAKLGHKRTDESKKLQSQTRIENNRIKKIAYTINS